MSVIKEFKEFISRGNVIDLAVGVVIGGAFTAIVTSLTNDILMPVISVITGKINIASLAAEITEDLVIPYGMFLQAVINFLLTAIAVFVLVKAINIFKKKMEALKKEEIKEEAAAKEPSAEEKLLTEIRDLLKEKN